MNNMAMNMAATAGSQPPSLDEPGASPFALENYYRNYPEVIRQCARHHGAAAAPIVARLIQARLLHGIGGAIFCMFAMHRRPASTWRDYRDFYQGHVQALRIINGFPKRDRDVRDKVAVGASMQVAGVASAPVVAVVGPRAAAIDGATLLASRESTVRYVEGPTIPAEIFVKPSDGCKGEGTFKAVREGDGWRVDGKLLDAAALTDRLWLEKGCNVVQPVLRTHSSFADIGGDFGLSTARVITARTPHGPEVLCVLFKLLQKPSTIDNFVGGANGVLLAPVDLETGRFNTAIGFSSRYPLMQERHDRHPRLGGMIAGREVPMLDRMIAVAKDAANALPERPMVGMDIALTDEGAQIVDFNLAWGCMLPQITMERGIADVHREWIPQLELGLDKRQAALLALQRK